jgi:hypothetical protein
MKREQPVLLRNNRSKLIFINNKNDFVCVFLIYNMFKQFRSPNYAYHLNLLLLADTRSPLALGAFQ